MLGADAGEGASPIQSHHVTQPTVLVVGSEGSGLRTNVRNACSSIVMIPAGLSSKELRSVESLNVSVASGILLSQIINSSSSKEAQ